MSSTNEIYHHGILGMKWGVRRYQKKDGSLTSAGKRRMKKSSEERAEASNAKRRKELNDMVKNRKLLSDKTLKEKIERIKLEKQFKDLVEEDLSPGRKAISGIIAESGKKAATTMLTGAMLYAGKSAFAKTFDRKEFGEAIFNGGAKKK